MTADEEFAEQLRARVDAAAPRLRVDTSEVIRGARRRRTSHRVAAVAGSVAVALGGWAAVDALPSFSAAVPPASETTPVDRETTCGAAFALEETDSPHVELQGRVQLGTLDRHSGAFETGVPGVLGDTLHADVTARPEVPDGPDADADRSAEVTTILVDPDGTVAFRTDPKRMIHHEATDGSGGTAPEGLYDAVDCRTQVPLTGTYRAYAMTTADGTDGGEVLELAPVSMERGDPLLAGQWPDRVPACGRPAPADLLAGRVDADFHVTLDPGVDLDDVHEGLHVDVTVTATGPDRLTGTVPQALHALLVDRTGTVVSRLYEPGRGEYDSAATFDVGQGESFPAELFQWFASCPDPRVDANAPAVRAGTYDLYVYDIVLASAGPGLSPAPRTAVGGPFPITLG